MNQTDLKSRAQLGTLFLAGQLIALSGVALILIGLAFNFIITICGFISCSCGFALVKYSKSRGILSNNICSSDNGWRKNSKFIKSVGYIGYASIIIAAVFLWFMFFDKPVTYRSYWPLYGFLASAVVFFLSGVFGSVYIAYKEFFFCEKKVETSPEKGGRS